MISYTPGMARTVLFLCTGNYYRSRFAEELFNHLAGRAGLDWVAASRGLALERGHENHGPISAHARAALIDREIDLPEPIRDPQACAAADLAAAERVIALKEAEHRPYLRDRHPGWADRVTYWHVHDLDQAGPDEAMGEIAGLVARLVDELKTEEPRLEPHPS